jgi:hypothetical protein
VALVFFITRDATRQRTADESTTDSGISESTSSWEHDRERENDGITGSECREDSPLLASGSTDHDLYTREKVEYYVALVNSTEENNCDRIINIRKTVGITAGGACEV